MTRFQTYYNNNLIKIVMKPATYFLRVSSTSFIWYNATLKWHLKNDEAGERDADFVLLKMLKKNGLIFTLYWWCPSHGIVRGM